MILGVVGPLCSGKDTLVTFLKGQGFVHISFGDILRDEMKENGIEITRDNIHKYALELRNKEGIGAVAERVYSKVQIGKHYLVQGFRNPEEVKILRNIPGFKLVSLDASVKKRFERMRIRARENDPISFNEFLKLDNLELGNGQREDFRIRDCMALADYNLVNDSTPKELKLKLNILLNEISAKA